MEEEKIEKLIRKIEKSKKKRRSTCSFVIAILGFVFFAELLRIYIICQLYSVSMSEVIKYSSLGISADHAACYPGYIVIAGVSFHMVLLLLLVGSAFMVFLNSYFKYQDLALQLYSSQKEEI